MILVEESIDQMNIARLQAAWTPRIHDFQPPARGRVELLVEKKHLYNSGFAGKKSCLS